MKLYFMKVGYFLIFIFAILNFLGLKQTEFEIRQLDSTARILTTHAEAIQTAQEQPTLNAAAAAALTRAEKEIDEVESRVKQVETQIRLFLRTTEIENEIKDIETAHLNEEGGFDCGFIFWYPKADSQLEKDMSLLVGANRRKLSWLDIAAPTFSQSINVQRYGAELIKKLVKECLGIELYYRSELD